MVWDQHLQHSIKESIRRKYGNGIRRKADITAEVPTAWLFFKEILRKSAN